MNWTSAVTDYIGHTWMITDPLKFVICILLPAAILVTYIWYRKDKEDEQY